MGRPKLDIKRDQQLNLRLTRPEMEQVQARADASGQRAIDFGRRVLLGSRQAIVPANGTLGKIERAWLIQIRRLGNNLNQLVRRMHALKEAPPAELGMLLQDIRQLIDRSQSHGP